jgi:hypothetical protein
MFREMEALKRALVKTPERILARVAVPRHNIACNKLTAGLPALQDSESGQVRKEAATAIYCKCRG